MNGTNAYVEIAGVGLADGASFTWTGADNRADKVCIDQYGHDGDRTAS